MSVETTEIRPDQYQPSTAHNHACRRLQHDYWLALDRLRRANRDLVETAAVMAASLPTVTAIQAVISIAVDKLNLPKDDLESAFYAYVVVIASIFAMGVVRSMRAFGRRGKAERDVDRAKLAHSMPTSSSCTIPTRCSDFRAQSAMCRHNNDVAGPFRFSTP